MSISHLTEVRSDFALKSSTFSAGILTVEFGGKGVIDGAVVFDYVRSFFLFKESDFHKEMAECEIEPLIVATDRSLGIFRVTRNSLTSDLLKGRLEHEGPSVFWVSSPDECLEIVSFEEPELRLFGASSPQA